MLRFTSALYLGLRHEHAALRPWAALTSGAPAALAPPAGAQRAAARLARLMHSERAVLAPSTLHVFWDLVVLLARRGTRIYVDAGAYAVARWGVERAAARRTPAVTFAHHRPDALVRLLRRDRGRPLVVADGFCPRCGRVAPLPAYLEAVRARDGLVVLDDTQALGILGARPGPGAPYGRGGAGSPAWHGVGGHGLARVCSLAKGFGAPLAVLAGSARVVARFEDAGATAVHCSPPSAAAIAAAERALDVNAERGDALRLRLAARVARFSAGAAALGVPLVATPFPVQTLRPLPGLDPTGLHERLRGRGVEAVLGAGRRGPAVTFLITARHSPAEIDGALAALAVAASRRRPEGALQ